LPEHQDSVTHFSFFIIAAIEVKGKKKVWGSQFILFFLTGFVIDRTDQKAYNEIRFYRQLHGAR